MFAERTDLRALAFWYVWKCFWVQGDAGILWSKGKWMKSFPLTHCLHNVLLSPSRAEATALALLLMVISHLHVALALVSVLIHSHCVQQLTWYHPPLLKTEGSLQIVHTPHYIRRHNIPKCSWWWSFPGRVDLGWLALWRHMETFALSLVPASPPPSFSHAGFLPDSTVYPVTQDAQHMTMNRMTL